MSLLNPFALKSMPRPVGVLFGASPSPMVLGVGALGMACAVARGAFHPAGVALLLVALALWMVALFPSVTQWAGFRSSSIVGLLTLVIVLQVAWSALVGTGLRDYLDVSPTIRLAPMVALLVSIPLSIRRPMIALGMSMFAFAFAVVTTILLTPQPFCDVWMFQQGAAHSLVSGFNPYHTIFFSPYEMGTSFYGPGVVNSDGSLSISFPYPPASLLLVLPGYLLGDVRFALLGWFLIGVLSLVMTHRPGEAIENSRSYSGREATLLKHDRGYTIMAPRNLVLIALVLLSSPHALMLVLTGWTESILIGLVGLTAWCFAKKPSLAWIPLGLLFASKQYLIVLAPVTFLFLNRSTVMKALLVAITLTLPFLYADGHAFYRSVVEFHFIQPFRADGLTLAAFIDRAFGFQPSALLSMMMVIVVFVLLRRNLCRDASMWFVGGAVTLVAFFTFSKQAFGNYYMLAIMFALAGLTMKLNRTSEPSL